jgi:hypothetical protein
MKDVWKSTTAASGGQYVMMPGTSMMLMWCADSWAQIQTLELLVPLRGSLMMELFVLQVELLPTRGVLKFCFKVNGPPYANMAQQKLLLKLCVNSLDIPTMMATRLVLTMGRVVDSFQCEM